MQVEYKGHTITPSGADWCVDVSFSDFTTIEDAFHTLETAGSTPAILSYTSKGESGPTITLAFESLSLAEAVIDATMPPEPLRFPLSEKTTEAEAA